MEAGSDQFKRSVEEGDATKSTGKDSLRIKFLDAIGAHEFCSLEMWRAALTETVASAFLIFTITSSIISCLDSHENEPKLIVPLAVFFIVFLFLIVTVPLSGGYMNPVFTFIAALKGCMTISRAITFFFGQCLGSIMAFLMIKDVMNPITAEKYYLGGCTIYGTGETPGLKPGTALLLEFACTFMVLYVGVTVILDKQLSKEIGLPIVCVSIAGSMASAVFVSITVTGRPGYAGAGLNPARCLGPALLRGGPLWKGHWVFWVGPLMACVVYYAFSINLPKPQYPLWT